MKTNNVTMHPKIATWKEKKRLGTGERIEAEGKNDIVFEFDILRIFFKRTGNITFEAYKFYVFMQANER